MSEFKFAQTLRNLIEERKIKVKDLTAATRISRQLISDYRRGISTPKYPMLVKLANYFGVSCDFLLTGFEHNDRKKQGQVPAFMFINLCNDAKKLLSKMHTKAERMEENLRQLKEFEDELYALLFKNRNISQQLDTQEEI